MKRFVFGMVIYLLFCVSGVFAGEKFSDFTIMQLFTNSTPANDFDKLAGILLRDKMLSETWMPEPPSLSYDPRDNVDVKPRELRFQGEISGEEVDNTPLRFKAPKR